MNHERSFWDDLFEGLGVVGETYSAYETAQAKKRLYDKIVSLLPFIVLLFGVYFLTRK